MDLGFFFFFFFDFVDFAFFSGLPQGLCCGWGGLCLVFIRPFVPCFWGLCFFTGSQVSVQVRSLGGAFFLGRATSFWLNLRLGTQPPRRRRPRAAAAAAAGPLRFARTRPEAALSLEKGGGQRQHREPASGGSKRIAAYLFGLRRCSTSYNTPAFYASRVQAVCRTARWAVEGSGLESGGGPVESAAGAGPGAGASQPSSGGTGFSLCMGSNPAARAAEAAARRPRRPARWLNGCRRGGLADSAGVPAPRTSGGVPSLTQARIPS